MKTAKEKRLAALTAERDRLNEMIRSARDKIARDERKMKRQQANVIGLAVLEMVEKGEWSEKYLRTWLDNRVKVKKHRDLFDLPPTPSTKAPHGSVEKASTAARKIPFENLHIPQNTFTEPCDENSHSPVMPERRETQHEFEGQSPAGNA